MRKICSKCNRNRLLKFFNKDCSKLDGYYSSCRNCERKLYLSNKVKYNIQCRAYKKNNKDKISLYNKTYALKNKDRLKIYREKNKIRTAKKYLKYINKKYKSNHEFRLIHNLRTRICSALKKCNKSKRTLELLGCSVEFLKAHLESQFKDGMNWNNYGKSGWEVDHIIPCKKFDLKNIEEQLKCFHYSNLQPLWVLENQIKQGF